MPRFVQLRKSMALISTISYSVLSLVAVIAVLLVMYVILTRKKSSKQPASLKVYRPRGLPFIGNALDLAPNNLLNSAHKWYARGKTVEVDAFDKKFYFVGELAVCREFLAKRPKVFRRPKTLDYSGDVVGLKSGLFHTHGPAWNRLRKLTSPTLAKYHITQNVEEMCNEALAMVKRMSVNANGSTEVDVKLEMFKYTLRVIIQGAFGMELTGEFAEYFFLDTFAKDLLNIFAFSIDSVMFPFPLWLWKLIPYYVNIERIAVEGDKRFSSLLQKIIDTKRKELAAHPESTNRHSVIDLMITKEATEGVDSAASDDEVLANVKTFFAAGSETTSVALSWALYFLSRNADILEEAREEAATFFKSRSPHQSKEELWSAVSAEKMPLCHAIIKEVLRLYTPGGLIFFELEDGIEEYTMCNGMIVKPGEIIMMSIDSIHWDENHFVDGRSFQPKRWLTADATQLAKMESYYFAFGGGTRLCPGSTLAYAEAVIGLSALIHHFDFDLACPKDEIKRVLLFTAQPTKMPMTFKKRG